MSKILKWIIIAVGVILAGILIFIIVKQSLREEIDLYFPDSIEINNKTDYDVVKIGKAISFYVLNLDTIKIDVVKMPPNMETAGELDIQAYVIKDPYIFHHYFIFLSSKLNQGDIRRVFSHEFIHILQMERGDLIQFPPNELMAIWKGDTIKYLEVKYEDRPQEIEAFNLEYKTLKELDKIWYK